MVTAPEATVELLTAAARPARVVAGPGTTLLDDLEALADPITPRREERGAGVGLLPSILFLRLGEERGLERFGALGELAEAKNIGAKLVAILDGAADRYGEGALSTSAGNRAGGAARPPLGDLEDAPLRDLLLRLYPAAKPDEFAELPPDALGWLYERSLAKGAPRTEARKAHGAFYTPAFVVDYVVERTLGRVLEGDDRDEAARARVLDPACGSGAFLLGAYRRLLEWHRRARIDDGDPRLTPALRKQILQNGIFGVDVDPAAIAIAKLSLLLACFDEPRDGDRRTQQHAPAALPRLDANLRTGHSLIDTDWPGATSRRKTKQAAAPPPEGAAPPPEGETLGGARPFAWRREFPAIFAEGGFDVVIGNPPYLSFGGRHAVDISPDLRRYYAEHYESGGWPTAHSLFLERSVKLLSRRFVSFVVPDQVGHLGGYRSARAIVQREAGLVEVRYWGERVFRGVTTPALTVVLDKSRKDAPTELIDRDGASRRAFFRSGEPWSVSLSAALIERLRQHSFSLGKLVGDCGIRTTSSEEQVVDWPAAAGEVVPVLEGKLIGRYGCRPPRVAVRLDSTRPIFISRAERYRDASFVIRQTASHPIVGPREHALYFRNSLLALFSPARGLDVHYLVALLNSKLLRFVYIETVREAHQRTFPQVKVKALQSLPLRQLDVDKPDDRRRHDAIVELALSALAEQRLALAAGGTDEERTCLRRFEAIDRKIDDSVYDLYELSKEERDTVEASLARPAH